MSYIYTHHLGFGDKPTSSATKNEVLPVGNYPAEVVTTTLQIYLDSSTKNMGFKFSVTRQRAVNWFAL